MTDINQILVLLDLSGAQKAEFESIYSGASYVYMEPQSVTEEAVKTADIIIGPVPRAMVQKLPKRGGRLKWMQLTYAGSDHMQAPGVFPEDAVLTNASGSYGDAMAEYMLGMLFTIKKNLHICRDNQNKGLWKSVPSGTLVDGAVTLVIGLGDIGGAFARRMDALGSYIIGVRRSNTDAAPGVSEMHLPGSIDALLPRADIVALALPSTPETRHTLSEARIAALKKDAVIINVGRGTAIDTEALCDALYGNKIGGAALDVTEPEPLPENHRLWAAPNCLITPHVSGANDAEKTYEKIVDLCLHNFRAFVSGGEMRNVVDFERGY
ncbi:MAG: D-2-hydroxyacid dehydrogenase [Defluviitaleaceae bacterium]|nr:D-2-hydroxyacid dehydrogenase [Defluviitaleaceae bacterium]MCL2836993.1 D-2-hydroxyacid dehydrogenase [Defluviitaleaceae bacterium]